MGLTLRVKLNREIPGKPGQQEQAKHAAAGTSQIKPAATEEKNRHQ